MRTLAQAHCGGFDNKSKPQERSSFLENSPVNDVNKLMAVESEMKGRGDCKIELLFRVFILKLRAHDRLAATSSAIARRLGAAAVAAAASLVVVGTISLSPCTGGHFGKVTFSRRRCRRQSSVACCGSSCPSSAVPSQQPSSPIATC
jgi:hypothetical protein